VLVHVKCVEVDPHRVRRIGEPPVSERVARQQITEFVANLRKGHRVEPQQIHPDKRGREDNQTKGQPLPPRESRAELLDGPEKAVPGERREPCEEESEQNDVDMMAKQSHGAGRVGRREKFGQDENKIDSPSTQKSYRLSVTIAIALDPYRARSACGFTRTAQQCHRTFSAAGF
jgi:hypothetical protein